MHPTLPYLINGAYLHSLVQVRLRPPYAQWRYKLDVLVDSKPVYFDRYPQKIQHFPGVTVSHMEGDRGRIPGMKLIAPLRHSCH